MSKSNRLRLCDLRGLYLLVGECREVGRDPYVWHTRMFEGLHDLLGITAGTAGMTDVPLREMTFASLRGFMAWGLTTKAQQEMGQRYWRENMHRSDPTVLHYRRRQGGVIVQRRLELVGNRVWYRSKHFQDYYGPADLDHIMPAVIQFPPEAPVRVHFIGLLRAVHDHGFTLRDQRMMELLLRELRLLVGNRLAPFGSGEAAPSPRMRQVLALLLRGCAEKEVARELGISQHTVHNHVKRLHRHFEGASRGELLARCCS